MCVLQTVAFFHKMEDEECREKWENDLAHNRFTRNGKFDIRFNFIANFLAPRAECLEDLEHLAFGKMIQNCK